MKKCSKGHSLSDADILNLDLFKDSYLIPYKDIILSRINFIKKKERDFLKSSDSSLYFFADYHKIFGLHKNSNNTWRFNEFAPNADEIYIIGDMTNWKKMLDFKLSKNIENGTFSNVFPKNHFKHNQLYKLLLISNNVELERIPTAATRVVQDLNTLIFNAQVWDPEKKYKFKVKNFEPDKKALLIYETHIGMALEDGRVGTFSEFEHYILPKIKHSGYNTIQLMAILEHPYYGSFGYHVTNFFAPSSRFGTPEELKSLIDAAHDYGIRVLIDIVHSHAANNEVEGLSKFDNTYFQFFYEGERGFHSHWDSRCFDYSKNMVIKFLLSNLRYWLEEFKVDGFRFDGITSMLFEDHGISKDFLTYDDYFNYNTDINALSYLYLANKLVHDISPHSLTIAEDVSGYPGLGVSQDHGGIGFDYRFAMGIADFWIRLLKEKKDEEWNLNVLWNELNASREDEKTISYAESHDQALVGDKTIMMRLLDHNIYDSMSLDNKSIETFRAVALHKMIRLITIATAKNGYLNFMGNEFGHPEWIDFPSQKNNWSHHYARRQWSLRYNKDLYFSKLGDFDLEMINLSKKFLDLENNKNELIYVHEDDKILVFKRKNFLFVFNFNSITSYTNYMFKAPPGKYKMIFETDNSNFGGNDRLDSNQVHFTIADSKLSLYIPTRTALVLEKQE
ncbi:MAG: alpha amylase C-terminal domain-containing protein [Desulfobacteraceae bacterium]|nr:alpha amylase C-terminal domain-containing protein [Desulfobacteraceae bacterium]